MRKLVKIISAILVIVLCVQIVAPGTIAIGATQFVGDNVAKSAAEGITISAFPDSQALDELEASETLPAGMNVSANDENSAIIGEVENMRTENTKHFRHEDGTFTAAIYSEPIHYIDSTGKWQDIDNTLLLNNNKKSVSGKATYTPKSNSFDINIPQDFSDNQKITIGKDGYTIGMGVKVNDTVSVSNKKSANSVGIDLSSKKAIINNYDIEIKNKDTSSIAETIEDLNSKEMELDKRYSSVKYEDVFTDTDLEYVITPSKIKESIIVNESQQTYVYQFDMDLDDLVSVPQENGSIKLFEDSNDTEAVFTIEAPYMFDAADNYSKDVVMTLNGNTLTVTADSEWINSTERVFPITIDPTISVNVTTFEDACVSYGAPLMNFDTYKYTYAGNGALSLRRTYLKFSIPTLPDGSVVTNAELKIKQHDSDFGDTSMHLYAFLVTSSWSDDSITWRNQPLLKEINGPHSNGTKIIDFDTFNESDDIYYTFNLTKSVKNWYEGTSNYGIMLTSNDENESSQATFYSYDHGTASNRPQITISYTNQKGLEDYWSYETVEMGRSGNIYVNDYNGSVTYLHTDLSMSGNLMPITIAHVYNSNNDGIYSSYYSGMYVGAKYHLNLQELLIPISTSDTLYSSGYRYKYYDGDGTLHYFKSNSSQITLEYDPTTYITTSGTDRVICYADGSKKYFYSDGRLYKIADKNGNTQTFSFAGKMLTGVTDGVGRTATIAYNQYGQLSSITDPAGRITSYTYASTSSSARLTQITYSDGNTTSLNYTSNDYLYRVYSTDNSNIYLGYDYVSSRGRRINIIIQYDKNGSFVDKVTFSYTDQNSSGTASGNTVVTGYYGKSKTILFNKYGQAISITNQDGQVQFTEYADTSNYNTFGNILDNSELQTISTNLLKNHGFERDDYWTTLQSASSGTYGYTSEESANGYRSMKFESTSNNGIFEADQDFNAIAEESYTISVDINIPNELETTTSGGAIFGIVYELDGEWHTDSSIYISSTSGWERFSHTATIPSGTVENSYAFVQLSHAKGKVYFDNIQVEQSEGSRYYNLVENSDFSNAPNATNEATGATAYAWTMAGTQSGDGVQSLNGRNFVLMSGSPDHNKRIVQKVPVNAQAGDTLIIGGRAAAYATDGYNDNRKFEAYIEIYTADNLCFDSATIEFERSVNMQHQTKATAVTLDRDCAYIKYYFIYSYHVDGVSFDDAFVYAGNYGEHYRYARNTGLVTSAYDDNGTSLNYDYNSSNRISSISQTVPEIDTQTYSLTYDNNGVNVTKIETNDGVTVEYYYNSTGQITSQTTTKELENDTTVSVTESATYIQNGNYLKTYTNANGGITEYTYDNNDNPVKGLVMSAEDPKGNVVNYSYAQQTDELLSISGSAEPEALTNVEFTYENYLPKTITRNGTTYSYEYDSQNRVIAANIGNQTLVSNEYDNHQRFKKQTYANGEYYSPVYDERDRVIGESWNNTRISKISYNENDRLSQFTDYITNTTYQYDYSFSGQSVRETGSDGTITAIFYDKSGTLDSWNFSVDNEIVYSADYVKNNKGYIEETVLTSSQNSNNNSSILLDYNYDELDRLSSINFGSITNSITYLDTTDSYGYNGSSTVKEYKFVNDNNVELRKYNYVYDNNGNITSVTEQKFNESTNSTSVNNSSYTYDGLNRLTEETVGNDIYLYSYDIGGNITSVVKNGNTIQTYAYDDNNWADKLTSINGDSITYDASGNPITYNGYSFTWQRNKLSSFNGNGLSVSYTYDAQGRRIQQIVNGETFNYLYSGNLLMRQTNGANVLDFQYDASGTAVSFKYNGVLYYYIRNLQGDVVAITDSNGSIVAEYQYDAWGNIISYSGAIASINPIRYRGYYQDPETGWYYLNSRYYNPEWRRFLNADSLFVAGDYLQGTNMFAYCLNNPMMYSDPSGYAVESSAGNLIRDIFNSIFGVMILKYYVDMPDNDITTLINEIDDSGDLYYVSLVILNGHYYGNIYSFFISEGITGRKEFAVCKAFTNKEVCKIAAKYYTWAYDGWKDEETDKEYEIAQEIYGHAMMYYNYDSLKGIIDQYIDRSIDERANPINLGGNNWAYLALFNALWWLP